MSSPNAFEKISSRPSTPMHMDVMADFTGSPRRGCCSPRALGWWLAVGGALMAIVAIAYGAGLPPIINSMVKSGVTLCDASDYEKADFLDAYGDCDDCAPYYFKLYALNASNAEAYLEGGVKLQLQEFGPYVYRRRQIRVDVEFDPDSPDTVSYKQYTYHTFEPEMSCDGCSDSDEYVSFDVGYLNVMAQTGGETGFLTNLARGSFSTNDTEIEEAITVYGPQMMRWINGLNSLDPAAMRTVASGGTVLSFLATGPTAIADLEMEGFAYNGLFVKRTISQWALGYPSLLAGLALGSNYLGVCNATDGSGIMSQCIACQDEAESSSETCLSLWSACKQCFTGASVLAINNYTCGLVGEIYAAEYGEEEAASVIQSTCGLCNSFGICAAPLPGIAEDSGLDYSVTPPSSDILNTYTQRTGCDDDSEIGVYERYDGATSTALWVNTLTEKRNPTLQEILDFTTYYGNCNNPTANLTCSPVRGNDATSVAPAGVNMLGFSNDMTVDQSIMYMDEGKQNVTLFSSGEEVKFSGIKLHRFIPSKTLLVTTDENADLGTGYPVDGVQSMAFTAGFLAYLSYPMFLWGNRSLTDNVELTMLNGVVASYETMYDLDESTGEYVLKDEYINTYGTSMNIEAGTGKTMLAYKRLMASYGISKSLSNDSRPMTDVLWPNLETDVVLPGYYGEETASVTSKQSDYYHLVKRILVSTLPVLIIGAIFGIALLVFGVFRLRRLGMRGVATKTP